MKFNKWKLFIALFILGALLLFAQFGPQPGGPAGGDLSSTYPNPTVVQVNGAVVPASATVLGSNSARQLTSTSTTGSGNVVLATSPTLATPNLGTPSALTLTNALGLPVGGLAAIAANTLIMNASGSSAIPTAVSMPTCTTGAVLYNTSTNTWSCVSVGSVTSVATNNGLTGGTITTTGTLGLASISNNNALCNNSGSSAVPTSANCTVTGTGNLVLATSPTITTPLIATLYGGSSAGSTITINGTSNGSPSAAYAFHQANGQYSQFGSSANPDSLVTINGDNTSAPGSPYAGTLLHVIAPSSSSGAALTFDAYGSGAAALIAVRNAQGTKASPTASVSSVALGYLVGQGYNGSQYNNGAFIGIAPTQTWSSSAQGTQMYFYTTANSATSVHQAALFDQDGQIYFPLLVNATGAKSGAVCYTSSSGLLTYDNTNTCLASSARFKNTITPYQATALGIINQLTPVTFFYNSNLGMNSAQHIGLIAEDVNKVAPQLVATDTTGQPAKIYESDLVTVLIKAVQEQQAQITALQNALKTANISIPAIPTTPNTYTPPVVIPYTPPPSPATPPVPPGSVLKMSFLDKIRAYFHMLK